MEKTTAQKIQLGLFVIIGISLFVLAIYFIGDKQKMFGKTNHLTSTFKNINGLQLGNNIRYSGITVGTVQRIQMINDTTIKVKMLIDKNIFQYINKNAVAIIGSDGLVGNQIINIFPTRGNAPNVTEGDEIKSISKVTTDEMLNTLDITNKNAALLTADLLKITRQINNGEGTIGLFLKDSEMSKNIKKTIFYLKSTSKGTTKLIDNANQTLTQLSKKNTFIGTLKDTTIGKKIKFILANLEQTSQATNTISHNLNETILNIKEGKGALNYLANNPQLVTKIDSIMTNLNEASYRLNEDLEALQHNFLFKSYFKKQVKTKKEKPTKQPTEMDKKY